mgnify:FL=1
MSEIKVNKISPRSGTEVTLGDSGDTFTIPSGATINNQGTATNFGATGSASWTTTVKTGDFTAVAGEGYFVNTTSGEIDVTLPAGSPGAVVAVKDYAKTFDTNNCILVQNGSDKIGGSTNNAILSTEGLAVTLIFIDSTQGWLVTDDGLQSVAVTDPFIQATGGTITNTPTCRIHTFTGPGTFSVTALAASAANNEISYLVVAGGGSGGARNPGNTNGGGGGGGFREDKSPVTPYTASPLDGAGSKSVTLTDFPIVVGAGGAAISQTPSNLQGNNGSVSSGFSITSAGGGGGGGGGNDTPLTVGRPGGSGGGSGGGIPGTAGGTGNTPPTTPAQGFNGGSGGGGPGPAGGGGGATEVGQNAVSTTVSGRGGAGATTSISGSPLGYGGGAGGSSQAGPVQGAASPCGSGGAGAINPSGPGPAFNGVTNRGGGGGGGYAGGCTAGTSGAGGSGVVIIRYKIA